MASKSKRRTTKAARPKRDAKIDEEVDESFPASDPPAFAGGHIIGAPPNRRTPQPVRKSKK